MGERKGVYRVWCGRLRLRSHKEDLGIDGRITLKLVLRNGFGLGFDLCGVICGHVSDCCERGNEPSIAIKYG
jgi:hypothetical protein